MASDLLNNCGARFSPKKTKSRKDCCVYGCSSNAARNPKGRFHHFPRTNRFIVKTQNYFGEDEKLDCRQMWIRVLKIGVNVTEHMVVCSLHFTKNDYFLPENSINTTDLESSIQDIEDVRNKSKLDEPGPKESDTFVSPEKRLIDFGIQVTSGDFDIDFFDTLKTDSDLNTLTGIANFKLFDKLIKIVEAD
ncbi:hypothetical protein KQX54_002495 [Cotesia glomerata]|uniref:THAP-type domain-containing protein n=1 Tax=Cotesia glomerata TaxID=32391 RepID=A0AAV7HWJ6_COTGL|nr:hypothetical protein KQX54_002495 [Cotesia glomerata]